MEAELGVAPPITPAAVQNNPHKSEAPEAHSEHGHGYYDHHHHRKEECLLLRGRAGRKEDWEMLEQRHRINMQQIFGTNFLLMGFLPFFFWVFFSLTKFQYVFGSTFIFVYFSFTLEFFCLDLTLFFSTHAKSARAGLKSVSTDLKEIIRLCLDPNPETRISVDELMRAPYFRYSQE
jgi:hypothetical protein